MNARGLIRNTKSPIFDRIINHSSSQTCGWTVAELCVCPLAKNRSLLLNSFTERPLARVVARTQRMCSRKGIAKN
jgi:hypothetical protein